MIHRDAFFDACGDGLHFGGYSSTGLYGLPSDWGDEWDGQRPYGLSHYSEKKFLKISYISYTGIQNLQEI